MSAHSIEVRDSPSAVAEAAAAALAERIAAAQRQNGRAHIVVTGGGIGTATLAALGRLSVDWSRVDLWWGDERFLPEGDPERNVTQAAQALLDHVSIPAAHIHAMPADAGQGAEQAARDYADELAAASVDGMAPRFDVLLLGMGPEGHVASIFPDSPAAHAGAPVVGVHDCPKPPPTRVSMTFPLIRSAREVWLLATGAAKAEAVAEALRPGADPVVIPAAGATGRERSIAWLDADAAALLA